MKSASLLVVSSLFISSLSFAAPLPGPAAPQAPQSTRKNTAPVQMSAQQNVNLTIQEAIDYYFKVLPPESMRQEVLLTIPMSIRDRVAGKLSEGFFRRHVGNALEKTFTASEIYAMAQFYGSSEGRSVIKKYPVFMKEIVDPVKLDMLEIMEAVKKEGGDLRGTKQPGNQ